MGTQRERVLKYFFLAKSKCFINKNKGGRVLNYLESFLMCIFFHIVRHKQALGIESACVPYGPYGSDDPTNPRGDGRTSNKVLTIDTTGETFSANFRSSNTNVLFSN